MHQLKSFDGSVSRLHRLEPKRGFDPAFQFAVIGLNHIVVVFDLAMLCSVRKYALAFERSDGLSVSGSSVGVNHRRSLPFFEAVQRLAEKRLAAFVFRVCER